MFRSRISKDDMLEVNDLSIQLALAFGGDVVKKETTEGTDNSDDGGAKPVPTASGDAEPEDSKPKLYSKPKRQLTRRVPCQHLMI